MKIKHILSAAIAAIIMVAVASCSDSGAKAKMLADAAAAADSIVSIDDTANVEVNAAGTGLDATFRLPAVFDISAMDNSLFEVIASQTLKSYPPAVIDAVSKALRENQGELRVELTVPERGQSHIFTITPRRLIELQRANLLQLDTTGARQQLVKMAESMFPNPDAAVGAASIDVAIAKGFLEYNVVWPAAVKYADSGQGLLTAKYFDALKAQYQAMGDFGYPMVELCKSLKIDGVRIVYSAPGSDATLRQAFPWREIQKPIEI